MRPSAESNLASTCLVSISERMLRTVVGNPRISRVVVNQRAIAQRPKRAMSPKQTSCFSAQPNESRLSRAAVLLVSQMQFYYTGRRQLQPHFELAERGAAPHLRMRAAERNMSTRGHASACAIEFASGVPPVSIRPPATRVDPAGR
jgi:hypothetical protein